MLKNYDTLEQILDNIDSVLTEAWQQMIIDQKEENDIMIKFSSIVRKNLKERPVIVLMIGK